MIFLIKKLNFRYFKNQRFYQFTKLSKYRKGKNHQTQKIYLISSFLKKSTLDDIIWLEKQRDFEKKTVVQPFSPSSPLSAPPQAARCVRT
jgi:hypothetical protein